MAVAGRGRGGLIGDLNVGMEGRKGRKLAAGKDLFPPGAAGQNQRDGLGRLFPVAAGKQEQQAETDKQSGA